MAEEKTVSDRVRAVIAEDLGKSIDEIQPDKTFEDLGCDSMDLLSSLFALEGEFDVEIGEDGPTMNSTVGDLINRVEGRING
ncbi:hypothetical protein XM25_00790 [Devosia sp. H5989]|nr:hypothetical protein XM25_00790 [Devosia sp. H5989]